jgi:group II intron reverse transcriptase/maturase
MLQTKQPEMTATKLARIAQLSRENPDSEFRWLMPHYNQSSLMGCFNELDGMKAVGVDGITKIAYGTNVDSNIASLIEKMKSRSYRPGPVREVLIPKEGKPGANRPLGISNFEDKLVQLMTSKILGAIYESTFLDCSYGFRPGRSCHTAIKDLSTHLFKSKCEVVIDVDLKNFFGTIDHNKLLEILQTRIKDETFIRYIVRMLKAGILSDGELQVTDGGSPQGNISSPILSNIYGHYVIDLWFEDVVKKHALGAAKLFRYCDDIVICCDDARDGERITRALKGRLAKYGLELNLEK